MTKMEYCDIYDQIKKNSRVNYCRDNIHQNVKDKTMLMVSHTLERGGAPLVLIETIAMFKHEYNIIFISMNDGDLKKNCLKEKVDVFIGNSTDFASCERKIWEAFDLVILNTIIANTYIPFFVNTKVKVIWWLHEPEVLFRSTLGRIIPFTLLSENITVVSVTKTTAECVSKYYGIRSPILHMGLVDNYKEEKKKNDAVVRFFMPAKFQAIKGQDILAQAILDMPPEYYSKMEVIFAGSKDEQQPEYYELIEKLSIALQTVVMLGEIDKEEIYRWYQKVDCVIAPSRMDATPTTIVEGMMFKKLCLCSDATGISKYMENGVNGFIFSANEPKELERL